MAHNHTTTRQVDSQIFEGVKFYLHKMTEGRRIQIRQQTAEPNKRIRDIMREQAELEKAPEENRDHAKWLDLQDEFDSLMVAKVNPAWVTWGVKKVEGLEADGKPLDVSEWQDWPSALFQEALELVRAEADLQGSDAKNLPLPTTSGEPGQVAQKPSTAPSAEKKDTGVQGTAKDTTPIM